jgi:general secretion pathway protein G
MDKKGFSLIEIIFVLFAITIIITVAVSKFDSALKNTNTTKIKSDVLQIRAGINLYKNKMILKNETVSFNTLDDNNDMLFSKVLQTPIISSTQSIAKAWSKISSTKYKVFLDNKNAIEFNFDTSKYTFDCDISNPLCKELNL